jgi:hypothetical protein
MLGSGTPTCNFPGKIPAGLDLPSDVADEKRVEEARKNWDSCERMDVFDSFVFPQLWLTMVNSEI